MSIPTIGIPFTNSNQPSAGSFLSLLREPDQDFKVLALRALLKIVDSQWSEISESIDQIEDLYKNKQFPQHELAAYLSCKVYYHLGDKDEALNLALESGNHFSLDVRTQFNECLTWHCIDQYIQHRQSLQQNEQFPPKKEQMVVSIILNSCKQGNHFASLGISLDCRRLDLVQNIITGIPPQQLPQVLSLVHTVPKGQFRDDVLKQCVDLMHQENKNLQIDEWANFVGVLVALGEVQRVTEILWTLLKNDQTLLAYQLAIDLAENQRPQFINQLIASLPVQEDLIDQRSKLIIILTGELQRKATLTFLKEYSQTDPSILTKMKTSTDPKQSVPHGAALMAHAFAQIGTQDASFLKNNLDWATKCNYWLRFTTTSTLGMIYKGNHEKSNEVLAPYMPQQGGNQGSNNVFENGGALYALGLINQFTHNPDVILKLSDAIRNPQLNKSEQVIHGACLGLGLVSFASEDSQVFDLLKEVLLKNESVYGEAAALALGLVYAGSNKMEVVQELLLFSRQTDKEKIIRNLGLSIAAVLFGQEDQADPIVDQMLADSEPCVRYGGCLTLAMAYVGTATNKVIERLLKQAVEDVADDVRRIAIISIAFVLFKNYEQIPKVMRLLILSYNPHIRYGTALALGIACAGTMFSDAISMLEPMLGDSVDFVRQAAAISLSLVMMQANNNCEPKFEQIKKTLTEMQAKKHETVLVKLGVFLSQGILDAGGRNLVVQLQSKQGFPKLDACIGMMVFTNYWFWFPMLPFLSLSLSPCAIIAVNENLAIPKTFQFQTNSKASTYGYPPHIKADEKKVLEKKTATLSTTNKVRARQTRREAERQGLDESSIHSLRQESQMSLEQQPSQILNKHYSSVIQTAGDDQNKMKTEDTVKKEEPSTAILNNPSRVLEKQKKLIQYLPDQRYEPLFKDRKTGIIILQDKKQGEQDDVIELFPKLKPKAQPQEPVTNVPLQPQQAQPFHQLEEEHELLPPEEFIFDPNQQDGQPK